MSPSGFPPIASLLPHAGPMCLLERVTEHQRSHTVCSVDPSRSALLAAPDGSVPVWVGLEYMAQCIAAHGGLVARALGEPLRPGVLLGSRRLRFGVGRFASDRELRVTARHHRQVLAMRPPPRRPIRTKTSGSRRCRTGHWLPA